MHYFVTVAEELHFGRAAQRLSIVQSAVSQQITRLERELGVRLLERTSRRVRLTPAGERVLATARETLAAAARVRVVAGEPAAVLRIGTASCATWRLDRALDRLRVSERPAEPQLIDLPVTARLAAVRDGELDLALVRGAITSSEMADLLRDGARRGMRAPVRAVGDGALGFGKARAQQRWRAVNAPHLVVLVRAGARFERGRLVERPEGVAV